MHYAKCSRTGKDSEISRYLQLTFLGTIVQQSLDLSSPPKISKDREIQNGNS